MDLFKSDDNGTSIFKIILIGFFIVVLFSLFFDIRILSDVATVPISIPHPAATSFHERGFIQDILPYKQVETVPLWLAISVGLLIFGLVDYLLKKPGKSGNSIISDSKSRKAIAIGITGLAIFGIPIIEILTGLLLFLGDIIALLIILSLFVLFIVGLKFIVNKGYGGYVKLAEEWGEIHTKFESVGKRNKDYAAKLDHIEQLIEENEGRARGRKPLKSLNHEFSKAIGLFKELRESDIDLFEKTKRNIDEFDRKVLEFSRILEKEKGRKSSSEQKRAANLLSELQRIDQFFKNNIKPHIDDIEKKIKNIETRDIGRNMSDIRTQVEEQTAAERETLHRFRVSFEELEVLLQSFKPYMDEFDNIYRGEFNDLLREINHFLNPPKEEK